MSLKDKILKDLKEAIKSQQVQKRETLRFLNSQIQNEEIKQGRRELKDEEILKIINNQLKKLKESIALFERGKREDLVSQAQEETKILSAYLPAQLSDEKLEKEIEKIVQANPQITQPGPLIGLCIKTLSGKADNQKIAALVKKKLS